LPVLRFLLWELF